MSHKWIEERVRELFGVADGDQPMTTKAVRLQLEQELGTSLIEKKGHILKCMQACADAAASAAEAEHEEMPTDEDDVAQKPSKSSKKGSTKPSTQQAKKPSATTSAGHAWERSSPRVVKQIEAARAAIKKAGLQARLASIRGIATMEGKEVLERLKGILTSAGLSERPSRAELAQFAAKKALERELDGIDTSNILPSTGGEASGGRPRRRSCADPWALPPELVRAADACGSPTDGNVDGGSPAAPSSAQEAKKGSAGAKRKRVIQSESDSSGSDEASGSSEDGDRSGEASSDEESDV